MAPFWPCTREAWPSPLPPRLSELCASPLSNPFSKQTYFLIKWKPDLCCQQVSLGFASVPPLRPSCPHLGRLCLCTQDRMSSLPDPLPAWDGPCSPFWGSAVSATGLFSSLKPTLYWKTKGLTSCPTKLPWCLWRGRFTFLCGVKFEMEMSVSPLRRRGGKGVS